MAEMRRAVSGEKRFPRKLSNLIEPVATAAGVTPLHIVGGGRIPESEGDRPSPPIEHRSLLVPKRFLGASFDTFAPVTKSQASALAAARRFVPSARQRAGPMLAVIGPQGCGKSHLLYATLNAAYEHAPYEIYARPWYLLADELRYGGQSIFSPAHHDEPHEVRARMRTRPIVFIDEVRPTASTEFDDTELAKFACYAYDAHVAVFITTNVYPLQNVMGPAAASRFAQLVVDGPDRRQP